MYSSVPHPKAILSVAWQATLGAQELSVAHDRALEITFEEYQGQVLEFLEGESADRYGTESAWDEIRLQVASLLERVMEQQEKPR